MAVNVIEIGTVYDALEAKVVGTLVEQYDAGRLKGKEYAEVMTASMTALISAAVSSVQQQPLVDGQVLDMKVKDYALLANTQKDIELKDIQQQLATAQVQVEQAKIVSMGIEDAVRQAQSTADLATKAAQNLLIGAQKSSEDKKTLLYVRQTEYYDDQVGIKGMEAAAQACGMYATNGEVPSGLEDRLVSAVTTATGKL